MILLLAAVAAWLTVQAPATPAQPLSANIPFHASIAGGERTLYSIDVPANHAARIIVRQQGIDLTLRLAPHGQPMPQSYVDFESGVDGEEHVYPQISDTAAAWDVRVGTALPRAERTAYVITAEVVPADEHQRAVTAARWDFFEAQELLNVAEAASIRRAQQLFARAAERGLAAGDLALAAEGTFQTGRTFDNLGDSRTSLEWQLRALELFRRTGNIDHQARVLNRLGDVSRKIGAVSDAEEYFRQASPLAQASKDSANVADILNNSGLLMLTTGRPEAAIGQLEGALPLAREVNSANVELALLNNLAEAYRRLGQRDKSAEYLERAVPVATRLNVPRRTARTLYSLAQVQFEGGDLARAQATMTRSLQIYDQSGDDRDKADAIGLQARLWYAAGDTDRAMAAFAQARPQLQHAQNRLGEATLLTAWAEAEIDRGAYEPALVRLADAVALSKVIAHRYTEAQAEYLRAVAYQKLDQTADALAAIQRAIDSVETMRGSFARADLRTSYLAAVRSYYDLHIDLLQQRGDAVAAFEVSERSRARALLEGLAESAARIEKGVDATLLARQRAIQRDLNAKEAYRAEVALRDGAQSASVRAVAAEVERLLDQWKQVRAQIRSASPAYAALEQPQPIGVKELQSSLLDANTALIAYHLGGTHSYAWVIDRGSITVQPLPPMKGIETIARRYHDALSQEIDALTAAQRTRIEASATAAGRELAALLWKPIEARVKGRRLLIVADRALHYVPFAALPTTAGTPILAAHEVVYLPSASVLASLRASSRPVALNAATAVFADPVFSKNDTRLAAARDAAANAQSRGGDGGLYGRLRFSRREAEAIVERSPGAFQALDFSASKSAVVSRNLRHYRVLHFATHGTLNTDRPELSGLVFSLVDQQGKAVDGFLRLHEIYNLDLDADLVVLSACRTALGREVHGEGLIGLTRGFMYAGASRVVSSVWNVDDRASALLMSRFYDAMRTRRLAPAAALREAQLSMLNDPRWSNPHYWAAFGLQGEWR